VFVIGEYFDECLSVCLFVRLFVAISRKPRGRTSPTSLCVLSVSVARGHPLAELRCVMHFRFSGRSCFRVMDRMAAYRYRSSIAPLILNVL